MITANSQKNANHYYCEKCIFKCCKKSEWDRHISTRKHIDNYAELQKNMTKNKHLCDCGKEYAHRQGLYTHKKTCNKPIYNVTENVVIHSEENENSEDEETIIRDASRNEIKILTSLVFEIFKSNNEIQQQNIEMQKQNQQFQKQIMEVVCKNIQPSVPTTVNNTVNANNTINATTNNHNKTFNLNFFLNEQCKNAMNLKDFVDSMEVTLEDAEKIGEEGYVEGMSSLLIRKINETDVFLRPIHCSDSKRDTLHIKRNDKWERDGPNNEHLTMAIKYVEQKNMIALDQFGEKYPDWRDSESPHNDKYMNMILKLTDSGPEEYKKVTKKIIKEVVIDKENV